MSPNEDEEDKRFKELEQKKVENSSVSNDYCSFYFLRLSAYLYRDSASTVQPFDIFGMIFFFLKY